MDINKKGCSTISCKTVVHSLNFFANEWKIITCTFSKLILNCVANHFSIWYYINRSNYRYGGVYVYVGVI